MPPKANKNVPPPPVTSQTTKKRTTLNSGGLGRFGEKLKKMTGSKDDLFRESSPAPAATAESATNISPEKEKNSQVESQDPKTPSSSTPFHSPTDLGGRRSPPSVLGTSSNASRLSNIAIPYGAHSDHQSLTDDSAVDQIIMKNKLMNVSKQ